MERNPFDNLPDDEHPADSSESSKAAKKKKKRLLPETEVKNLDQKRQASEDDGTRHEVRGRRLDLSSLLEANKHQDEAVTDSVEGHDEAQPEVAQNPEDLSEEELQLVAQQIIEDHGRQLQEELASVESDSPKAAEVLGDAYFIESLAEEVDQGKKIDDELLDELVDSVAREFASERAEHATAEEVVTEDGETADDEPAAIALRAAAAAPPTVPPPPPPPPRTPGPSAPTPGPGGSGPVPARTFTGAMPAGPATSPRLPHTRSAAHETVRTRYRGADLLVGGIVGYLIGRRRGRIRTEARLMPIQQSLEKQVRDLDEKISSREKVIRSMVAEKIARGSEDMRRSVAEKVEAKTRAKEEARRRSGEARSVRPAQPEQADKVYDEAVISERTAASPHVHRHDRLASAVIAQTEVRPALTKEAVNRMSDSELLKIAATIEADGQTAQQLYEQGRLSREDLQAVVTEQLIGQGRVERLLRERQRPVEQAVGTREQLVQQSDVGQAAQTHTVSSAPVPDSLPVASSSPGTDVAAASDALIAEHAARERRTGGSYSYVWIIVGIVAALFILSLLLL